MSFQSRGKQGVSELLYLILASAVSSALTALLVSSALVSHLSLASPPLTGGTCPRVPLRISRFLFKSISMLNSRWRGSRLGGVTQRWRGPLGVGGESGPAWMEGRGWDITTNHDSFTPSDPGGWAAAPPLPSYYPLAIPSFSSSSPPLAPLYAPPFPHLAFHHSAFSPLAFLILFPSPSSLCYFLFLSLSHSTADFHSQGRVLISDGSRKRVVTRCCAWVCFCLCVCLCPSHATPGGSLCIASPSLYNNDMSAFQSSRDNA